MAAPLTGIDVSRHQGVIDYNAVRSSGRSFAFIKATDGIEYAHIGWFRTNLPKVKAAGLIPGAYHFLLDHYTGTAQARYYVAEVNRVGGFDGVVPIVDIEREADGTTPAERHLAEFVNEFRRLVPGRQILIYTGKWYWVGVLGNPPTGSRYGPLWHSEYDGRTPVSFDVANGPELDTYGGWTECLVWQHTSSGSCPGVAGSVDLNLFYGDRQQLLALAGAATPVEDDMNEDEIRDVVRSELQRALAFLTTGSGNQLTAGQVWVADATTNNELLAAIKAQKATVDVDALAVALGEKLDGLDEAKLKTALREVFADAGTAG